MADNFVLAQKALRILGVKYSLRFMRDEMLSHPDFPSLLSYQDFFSIYKIQSIALKTDFIRLKQLPLPILVQVNNNESKDFYLVNAVTEKEVNYFDEKGKEVKKATDQFLKQWTGVCLPMKKTTESGEPLADKKKYRKRMMLMLGFSLAVLFGMYLFLNPPVFYGFSLNLSGVLLLKLAGVLSSALLLWYEIDKHNPSLQNFCSGGGAKTDCNKVLNSDFSKLFRGELSLSILSLSYFFSSFLLYYFVDSSDYLQWTAILSFLAVPVAVFSLYLQKRVIKQWCKFCLFIQGVIFAEFFFTLVVNTEFSYVPAEAVVVNSILFLLLILGWKLLHPYFTDRKNLSYYYQNYNKLKRNTGVFGSLLKASKRFKTSPEDLGIYLAHPNAKYEITKVCNPYCGPCASAHPILEELFENGLINLRIIFTTDPKHHDFMYDTTEALLALCDGVSTQTTRKILDEWYRSNKISSMEVVQKNHSQEVKDKFEQQMEKMYQWCTDEKIAFTPTIYVNGYQMIDGYSVSDLKVLLT